MKNLILYIFFLPILSAWAQTAGVDVYTCEGQSVQLNATISANVTWQPANFLDDPTSNNPIVSGLTQTTDFIMTTNYQNQIVNGDFSNGNVGFVSDYTNPTTGGTWGLLSGESTYAITNDASSAHVNFNGLDHTNPPNGNFMVVNGSSIPNTKVWCQIINLEQNTDYEFSTWVTTVVSENEAILEFSINGVAIGQPFTAPSQTNVWNEYFANWNSGLNTTAEICIVNQNFGASGNDFGIDDISFNIKDFSDTLTVFVEDVETVKHTVTLCEASNLLGTSPFDVNTLSSQDFFQSNDGLDWYLNSQLSQPLPNSWIHASENMTIYATESNNRCKIATIDFIIHSKPEIDVSQEEQLCLGDQYHFSELNLFYNTFDSIQSLEIYNLDGMALPNTNYMPSNSETIIFYCETEYGCRDTSSMQLIVNDLPQIDPGPPQAICSSTGVLNAIIPNNVSSRWIGQSSQYVSDINNPQTSVTINEYGTYHFTIEVSDQNGCKNQATTSIDFDYKSDLFNADFYIDKNPIFVGEDVRLINTTSDHDIQYFWDLGNGHTSTTHSQTFSYNSTGLYNVTLVIENQNGCQDSITKEILVHPFLHVFIPSSFTPNSDSINDIFEVQGNGILNYEIYIFNQWGERVYSNKNTGWDGTYNQKFIEEGVYAFRFIVEDFKKKLHHFYGEVSLLR